MSKWFAHNWWIFIVLGISFLAQIPVLIKPLSQVEAIQIMAVASKPFDLYHYQPQQLSYDPPAIYYLLKTAAKLSHTAQLSDTLAIAHSASQIVVYNLLIFILPNLLTLFGAYLIGTKFLKRKISLLICFFLAFLPLIHLQNLTLQPFSWTLTCVIWSWLFLLELLGAGRDVIYTKRTSFLSKLLRYIPFGYNYVFFLVFTMLGIYTSYFYFLFLIIQLIVMGCYHRWKRLLLTILFVIIAYIPWLPFLNRQFQIIPAYQEIIESLNSR